MGDFKARIKAKLLRRHSTSPSVASSKNSSKSGRPPSQRTNDNYAASSTHISHGAGDNGDHKDQANLEKIATTSSTHVQSYRHAGGHQLSTPVKHAAAGKSRPSTAASSHFEAQKSPVTTTTLLIPDKASFVAENDLTVVRMGSYPRVDGEAAPATATATAPAVQAGAVSGQGAETLASSNVNISNSKKTSSSPALSGNDQHLQPSRFAVVHANSSTTLLSTSASLQNIDESPATPPSAIATRELDPTQSAFSSTLPKDPLDPLTTKSEHPLNPTTTLAHLGQPVVLTTSDLPDAISVDLKAPTTPRVVSDYQNPSPTTDRPGVVRRQSILPNQQHALIRTLLGPAEAQDIDPDQLLPISATMVTRKIWVKRPGASATMVTINEDDLVDDVRDMILRKYANSLGRQFDSPDLTLRVAPKEQAARQLQPDEPMGRTLDAYFPGGQTVDDAVLIDIPPRRTPKASPIPRYHVEDSSRPHESGTDYFPLFQAAPHAHHPSGGVMSAAAAHFPPSMAIVNNGQLPPLPSPGGTRRLAAARPKMTRLHTASPGSSVTSHVQHAQHVPVPLPTSIGTITYSTRPQRSRTHSGASSDQTNHAAHAHPHPPPTAPPMPTPPAPERVATPPPRVASPRPAARPKKKRTTDTPSLPPGMLNGSVPPINVLIVEDNIINLKLLEAFVKRLKVRWQTAMNGRDAVNKWRTGGFHLVLMDIQLPIMNGLDATREIRRIEKVNSIGVFSSSASKAPDEVQAEPDEKDKLPNTEMFKSPVIIVALTASSLQSDRHEALAAGCNDFLTKVCLWLVPVDNTRTKTSTAGQFCLAREKSYGMGLHAGPDRL